jgi:hypothetical protein
MSIYIITAEPQEQFDCKNESMGMSGKIAIFYSKKVGRKRYYRNSYPTPNIKGLKILSFKTKKAAQEVCDYINKNSVAIYKVEFVQ